MFGSTDLPDSPLPDWERDKGEGRFVLKERAVLLPATCDLLENTARGTHPITPSQTGREDELSSHEHLMVLMELRQVHSDTYPAARFIPQQNCNYSA